MIEKSDKKSYLDRLPPFSVILTMTILMIIGLGLTPLLDIAQKPQVQQGAKMSINFRWPYASPQSVEQEVTSKIEGLVAAVNGVKEIESTSYMGRGYIKIELKENVDLPSVRFEIASILRQIYKSLPEDVSYPTLSGGRKSDEASDLESINLLNYRINAAMDGENLKDYVDQNIAPALNTIDQVDAVWVSGGNSHYMEVVYDPLILANYKINAAMLYDAVLSFIGKDNVVGEVETTNNYGDRESISLLLTTASGNQQLENIPITKVGEKIIYLNDLATYEIKEREPNSYFRIDGLNTVSMTIAVDPDANIISLSEELRNEIEKLKPYLSEDVHLTLNYDASEEVKIELHKLVSRISLSLLILLAFVWLVSRNLKYLSIISITLLANVLIAIIFYYLLNIRLHIFSMAGISVSFGIIIDSTIVMVDHYSYYRNRKSFLAILAALLTTIGSLIIVFFLPDVIKQDLYDFSRIIIINLTVALFVALFFVPALVTNMSLYRKEQLSSMKKSRKILKWNRFYGSFIAFTQKKKWVYVVILIFMFGIPIFALPDQWPEDREDRRRRDEPKAWYIELYNSTIGSEYYISTLKEPIAKFFGGSLRLFTESLSGGTYYRDDDDIKLKIYGRMQTGSTAFQLNQKAVAVEEFLSQFDEISRFETYINGWGAYITVEFKEEYQHGDFPAYLENEVISKLITIGGIDWSTRGVSDEGFSNSLNLSYRNLRIIVSGYSYSQLYQHAEMLCDYLRQYSRVIDLAIENNGRAKEEEEIFLHFDREFAAQNNLLLKDVHTGLSQMIQNRQVGWHSTPEDRKMVELRSIQKDEFDLWNVENSYIKIDDNEVRFSTLGTFEKRITKSSIPKKNQEYILTVAYNYMGDRHVGEEILSDAIDHFNENVPIGFKATNNTRGWYKDEGTQYWLILLIVVIIFFVCSILFESLIQPLVIISLIPISFIGTFLTFHWCGVNFGTGGFASLVLLSGLVVNAAIYLINEYNIVSRGKPSRLKAKLYLKAYNHKVIPVFLTVVSTILGLIPFLLDGPKETFWFPFAIGTCGGLLFSILALVFIMPIFMPLKNKK